MKNLKYILLAGALFSSVESNAVITSRHVHKIGPRMDALRPGMTAAERAHVIEHFRLKLKDPGQLRDVTAAQVIGVLNAYRAAHPATTARRAPPPPPPRNPSAASAGLTPPASGAGAAAASGAGAAGGTPAAGGRKLLTPSGLSGRGATAGGASAAAASGASAAAAAIPEAIAATEDQANMVQTGKVVNINGIDFKVRARVVSESQSQKSYLIKKVGTTGLLGKDKMYIEKSSLPKVFPPLTMMQDLLLTEFNNHTKGSSGATKTRHKAPYNIRVVQ